MFIVIFTNSYPYRSAVEQNFLSGEVKILRKYFDRIVICPQFGDGELLPLPDDVEANISLSKRFNFFNLLFAGLSMVFLKDLYKDILERLPNSLSFSYLKKIFFFLARARLTQQWFETWLKQEKLSASDIVCYTFWFTEVATGLGWVKQKYPDLRIVSRTHGYDLYEELYKPWPIRVQSISMLDGLFADSNIGMNYLRRKYPQFIDRFQTALLGVPEPGGLSKPSTDGVLRIVSCSLINPIKRIDLLFAGIITAAQRRKSQKIEWTHFGGGAERQEFIDRIAKEFQPNAIGSFPGYQTQQYLIQNYINNPIDVFVNVSSTEGTSVAMMEAISCGIPVIATAVGGNVEVVREKNGFLLSADPTPDEVADALLSVCDHHAEWLKKRQGSHEIWRERYNETTNFESFAQLLVKIRNIDRSVEYLVFLGLPVLVDLMAYRICA